MREGSGFADVDAYPAEEPSAEEMARIVDEYYAATVSASTSRNDLGSMGEKDPGVVFQGPGDPLEATRVVLDTVASVAERRNGVAFRLNTFGLGAPDALLSSPVLAKDDVDRRRETRIAVVSVFLPASDPKTYDALVRPREGRGGFRDACAFVATLAEAGVHVECTAVDRPDVRIAEIERMCRSLGARDFRARSYVP